MKKTILFFCLLFISLFAFQYSQAMVCGRTDNGGVIQECSGTTPICKPTGPKAWQCVAKIQDTTPGDLKTKDPVTKEEFKIEQTAPGDLVSTAVQWFIIIAGILSVAGIIYGGILYTTASGNPERQTKAKTVIFYSILGGVVILLAYGILTFATGLLIKPADVIAPQI